MTFPQYPAYKNSGVEWLGEVPEHWAALRLRFVATLNPSKQEAKSYADDELVSFLPMEAIGEDGSLSLVQEKQVGECLNGYTYFTDGDVCIAKITPCFENGKGAIFRGLKGGIGFGTTELIVARPKAELLTAEFLDYLFRSNPFRTLGEAAMYGAGGQKRVPDAFVRDFSAFLPPLTEQQLIASFLDRETAKIDTLITEQQRLIGLLQEKRQAVISHAVTKGLDPNAPMKDSGVEWLGEVPEHWDTGKIKHYFRTTSGSTPNSDKPELYYTTEEDEQGTPWIRTTDINNDEVRSAVVFITPKALEDTACKALPVNTVLVALYGGGGTVGKNGILKIEAAVNQALCGILPSPKALPEYVHKYIQFLRPFWMERAVSARKAGNISQELVGDTTFPIPPLQEQMAILRAIEEKLMELDELAKQASESLVLLEERRSAIISAAVTGQIDVRGLVPEAVGQ